MVLFLSESGAK